MKTCSVSTRAPGFGWGLEGSVELLLRTAREDASFSV